MSTADDEQTHSSPPRIGGLGQGTVLVTGATGHVGGRLLHRLEASGRHRVRCLTRRPEALAGRTGKDTEVAGDVLDTAALRHALEGVDAGYYLIQSMEDSTEFEALDRTAARNFADAARSAGLRRVIYLGGLGRGDRLSPHLASRQEVGAILRSSGVPTIEFRASIVIGSGSASCELVRALVETLPLVIAPPRGADGRAANCNRRTSSSICWPRWRRAGDLCGDHP
jgi:uncharacterized protein YbjT (DUF2867 family)